MIYRGRDFEKLHLELSSHSEFLFPLSHLSSENDAYSPAARGTLLLSARSAASSSPVPTTALTPTTARRSPPRAPLRWQFLPRTPRQSRRGPSSFLGMRVADSFHEGAGHKVGGEEGKGEKDAGVSSSTTMRRMRASFGIARICNATPIFFFSWARDDPPIHQRLFHSSFVYIGIACLFVFVVIGENRDRSESNFNRICTLIRLFLIIETNSLEDYLF